MASHWFGGYISSLCSPQGFFVSGGVTVYLLVYSGRSCLLLVRGQNSRNKPNGFVVVCVVKLKSSVSSCQTKDH